MNKNKYILSDEDIRDLSDLTPFAEGDPVCFLEDGDPECGFWAAAEEVAAASAVQAAKLETGQARALFHMRSFYLLGVIRGAEAYRSMLKDEEETLDMVFSLDSGAAEEFREDLEAMPPELFQRLTALLGMSVKWADRPQNPSGGSAEKKHVLSLAGNSGAKRAFAHRRTHGKAKEDHHSGPDCKDGDLHGPGTHRRPAGKGGEIPHDNGGPKGHE